MCVCVCVCVCACVCNLFQILNKFDYFFTSVFTVEIIIKVSFLAGRSGSILHHLCFLHPRTPHPHSCCCVLLLLLLHHLWSGAFFINTLSCRCSGLEGKRKCAKHVCVLLMLGLCCGTLCHVSWCRWPGGMAVVLWDTVLCVLVPRGYGCVVGCCVCSVLVQVSRGYCCGVVGHCVWCVLVQVTWGYGCDFVGHCVICPGVQGIWLCCGTLCMMCPGAGVHGVWLWCCGTLCDVSWCRCPGGMAVLWDTVWCVLVQVSRGYGCVVGHCVICPGAGV